MLSRANGLIQVNDICIVPALSLSGFSANCKNTDIQVVYKYIGYRHYD